MGIHLGSTTHGREGIKGQLYLTIMSNPSSAGVHALYRQGEMGYVCKDGYKGEAPLTIAGRAPVWQLWRQTVGRLSSLGVAFMRHVFMVLVQSPELL
jgi:hypothetical protein